MSGGVAGTLAVSLLSGFCVLATGIRTAQAQQVLTLAEAVEQALRQNDAALTSTELLEQAQSVVEVARSAFSTKLNSNVFGGLGGNDISNQSYSLDVTRRLAIGTAVSARVGATSSQNQIGTYYSTDTTVVLTQPILRGFGRALGRRDLTAAEMQLADARRRKELSDRQLAIEVATAYYRVVTQVQMVETSEKALERARQLLAASTAKLSVGRVSRLDLVRAEQLVAEADLQLVDAQAGVQEAKDDLRLLMNRESDYEFTVSTEIPIATELIGEDEAVASAIRTRLELRATDEDIEQARLAILAARNHLLPKLDVNLALTRQRSGEHLWSSFGLDAFQFATFASVSMPFDRTADDAAYRTAVIELGRRQRARAVLERRIVQEARKAVRQCTRLERSLQLADASVAFASQEAELAAIRYERGLSNNLDMVNAEANLLAARNRRLVLLAEIALSRLRLRAAIGTLDPRTDVR